MGVLFIVRVTARPSIYKCVARLFSGAEIDFSGKHSDTRLVFLTNLEGRVVLVFHGVRTLMTLLTRCAPETGVIFDPRFERSRTDRILAALFSISGSACQVSHDSHDPA